MIIAALAGAMIWATIAANSVQFSPEKLPQAAGVYDENGARIDGYIEYDDIPRHLINAFLAVEDRRFYQHPGLDYMRIAGAAVENVKRGGYVEGGSTISQQLIKNTHLSGEKSVSRKLKEAQLAGTLEQNYTKQHILEMYLNIIYMCDGVYGVKAAARRYFDKTCAELTLAECALIAGVTKNPKRYSPVKDFESSLKRQKVVLAAMLKYGFIDEETHNKACAECINIAAAPPVDAAAAYVKSALYEAESILGGSVSGHKIITYMHPQAQRALTFYSTHPAFAVTKEGQMCMSVCNKSRGVTALYSNVPYPVFTVRRPPASIIKPAFSYAAAYGAGLSPGEILPDLPADFNGYSPKNHRGKYRESLTLEDSLALSSNIAALHLTKKVGLENCFDAAKRLGFTFDVKDASYAAALGGLTYGSTVVEIATAYAAIADGGTVKNVSFVKEIYSPDGQKIYCGGGVEKLQAITGKTTDLLLINLRRAVTHGTAKKLSELPFPVHAKTGTAEIKGNLNSDAWCVAGTRDNTLICWYGIYDPKTQTGTAFTGGGRPAMLAKYCLLSLNMCYND